MGVLGDIVSNSVQALSADSSQTTLQTFLQKFNSSSGRYVDTIDPLGTFDVSFKFHPTITAKALEARGTAGALSRLGTSLVNSLATAGTNFLDNVTGGLFSSVTDGLDSNQILSERERFISNGGFTTPGTAAGTHTFMEYLAPANGLQGGENWQNSEQASAPLVLQLGPYVQKITGINIMIGGEGKTEGVLGEFPINGTYVKPSGELQMEILNTRAPLIERIFYPWMREITLPWWNYEAQPYTTATVTVDFTKHSDTKYVFIGCRPNQIKLMDATQEASSGNIARTVNFLYDYVFITSKLKTNDTVLDKVMGTASAAASGAASLLNI